MKHKFFRGAAALACLLLFLPAMSLTAFAQGDDPSEETAPPAVEETTTAKPFTPDGTGTVVDNATDEDGKEFFTITTPSENIFYLVIDRQRDENNVYFLNAVTESDLLALAEPDPAPPVTETDTPQPTPEPDTVEPEEPEPDTAKAASSGLTNILVIVAILLVGGAAAYYFKIYRPQHEAPAEEDDEYDYGEGEDDLYADTDPEDDTEAEDGE